MCYNLKGDFMDKIYIEQEMTQHIINQLIETKEIVLKQTSSLEHILINKIVDDFNIDKNRLQTYFTKMFTVKVLEVIDNLFKSYYESELEFYSKNLKTTDLIFNSLTEKRTQTIYLDNIIKKVKQKESNKNDIQNLKDKAMLRRINIVSENSITGQKNENECNGRTK